MNGRIDSITLEILWNRLIGIANEVAVTLMRTSFSSIIRDSHDFSIALFDDQKRYIAQADGCTPGQLGCMLPIVKNFCTVFSPDTLQPGDELIMNDPWLASSHLDDISICKPIFYGERLIGYGVCTAHHMDIGGRGATLESKDVFEEGLWIPLSKICKAGVENEDVFNFVRHNVRVPEKVIGDLRAQLAANHLLSTRVVELLKEYELEDLGELSEEILSRTEKSMRAKINEVPNGTYPYTHYLNKANAEDPELKLSISIHIEGDEIVVDYEGTSRQVDRAINCCQNMTYSYTLYALKSIINPSIPNNAGCMYPISIRAPEGTVVNPRFPAPVWGRTEVAHVIPETIYSALASVLPGRIIAQSNSSPMGTLAMRGVKKGGQRFLITSFFFGGMGAASTKDGMSCLSFPTTVGNTPIEILEGDAPVLFEKKELLCDSGGPGKFKGGCGQKIVFTIPEGEIEPEELIVASIKGGKLDHPAEGVLGGKASPLSKLKITDKVCRTGRQHLLKPGDRFEYEVSGGGGYGDPLERDLHVVAEDVRNGLVSIKRAKEDYGVVLKKRSLNVDEEASKRLRGCLRDKAKEEMIS